MKVSGCSKKKQRKDNKRHVLDLLSKHRFLTCFSLYHVGNQYDLIYHRFTSLLLRPKICAKVTQKIDIYK
jgi:hypothetical protein